MTKSRQFLGSAVFGHTPRQPWRKLGVILGDEHWLDIGDGGGGGGDGGSDDGSGGGDGVGDGAGGGGDGGGDGGDSGGGGDDGALRGPDRIYQCPKTGKNVNTWCDSNADAAEARRNPGG